VVLLLFFKKQQWIKLKTMNVKITPAKRLEIKQHTDMFAESVDLEQIEQSGIDLDPSKYDFVYGYPALSTFEPIINRIALPEPDGEMALYIHIPFCNYACSFCYFVKSVDRKNKDIEDYIALLSEEIRYFGEMLQGKNVTSVYIGGGTPTLLASNQLSFLHELILKKFMLSESYEWTVEASPETIDQEKLDIMASLGVNRVSLGIQSTQKETLNNINRGHSKDQAFNAARMVIESKIPCHNIDFIYGLPFQIPEDIWNDFELINTLDPKSVTWYQLWRQVYTPLANTLSPNSFPDRQKIHYLKCLVRIAMKHFGYKRDMVDWFVKDWNQTHHQQEHKWKNKNFLGLGQSSYGYVNGFYYRNHTNMEGYYNSIRRTGNGIGSGVFLSRDQIIRRKLILGIKLREGVLTSIIAQGTKELELILAEHLKKLIDAGLIYINRGHFVLSEIGEMYGDNITSSLGSVGNKNMTKISGWRYNQPIRTVNMRDQEVLI
jgi:oxygen-independent coproporphyrinogen-3 oxidase